MTSGLSSFALGGGATQKQRVSYFYDGNTAMLICQDAISGSPFQPFVNVMETRWISCISLTNEIYTLPKLLLTPSYFSLSNRRRRKLQLWAW